DLERDNARWIDDAEDQQGLTGRADAIVDDGLEFHGAQLGLQSAHRSPPVPSSDCARRYRSGRCETQCCQLGDPPDQFTRCARAISTETTANRASAPMSSE